MDREELTDRRAFGYRPGLDGLRAVAVVVVVAFHAGLLDGGWVGVDVFFVLSGWLITGLLLGEIDRSGRLDLAGFWRRRVRRLLPAVVVTLGFVTVLAVSGALDLRRRGVVGALTYSTNWLNITGSDGYWDAFAAPDPLRHLWSLAVEEQIYLVWPVVVVALLVMLRRSSHRRAAVAVRVAAGMIAIASVAVAAYGASAGWSIDRLYQGTDTRASAFAAGAVVAGLAVPRLGDHLRHAVVMIAIAAALLLGLDGGRTDLFRLPIHLVTLCGVVAVTVAAGIRRGPLCWEPVRRLGAWSYGIYLVHYPLTIALADQLSAPWLTVVVLALSIPIAAASHRLVEQPIRHHGLPGRRLGLALAAASAIAITAIAVAVPVAPAGLDDLPVLASPATTQPFVGPPAPADQPVEPSRRILVVGDSVPALAADELALVADERGDELGVLAQRGCVGSPYPIDQFLEDDCAAFVDGLRDGIAAQDPAVVLWWWGGVGATQSWNGDAIDVCSLAGFAAASAQVTWQLSLAGNARSVIVVPPARTDLGADAAQAASCRSAALLDAAGRAGVEVVRLDRFICPDPATDCNRVERVDGLHVDGDAAVTVAHWLLERPVLGT